MYTPKLPKPLLLEMFVAFFYYGLIILWASVFQFSWKTDLNYVQTILKLRVKTTPNRNEMKT